MEQYIRDSIKDFIEEGQGDSILKVLGANTQEGLLDMESYESLDLGIPKDPKCRCVVLDFEVHPTFLRDLIPNYSFLYAVVGLNHNPTLLSQLPGSVPRACVSEIQLRCLGTGYYQGNQTLDLGYGEEINLTENIIFSVPFIAPPGSGFELRITAQHDGSARYACDMWERERHQEKPLVPFGGYFEPNLDFSKVIPMLGALRGGAQTEFGIKALSFWMGHGLSNQSPAFEGNHRYSMLETGEGIFKASLLQQIQQGDFKISIQGREYGSRGYKVLDPFKRRIQMSFVSME